MDKGKLREANQLNCEISNTENKIEDIQELFKSSSPEIRIYNRSNCNMKYEVEPCLVKDMILDCLNHEKSKLKQLQDRFEKL